MKIIVCITLTQERYTQYTHFTKQKGLYTVFAQTNRSRSIRDRYRSVSSVSNFAITDG